MAADVDGTITATVLDRIRIGRPRTRLNISLTTTEYVWLPPGVPGDGAAPLPPSRTWVAHAGSKQQYCAHGPPE